MYIPSVSILMPVRNGERYIGEALDSLAAQRMRDFEVVVIDNGSTDRTGAILADRQARDPRLVVRSDPSLNLAAALNLAARLARAPILARLDSDDLAEPDRLEAQLAFMRRETAIGLLGSAVELIDGEGRILGRLNPPLTDCDIRKHQRTSSAIVPSAAVFRTDLFWQAGAFREGLNVSEDFDLWTRLGEQARMANLPDALSRYRIHPASVTACKPVRIAIASYCVTAAARARATGAPEPFINGVPSLRQAIALTGAHRGRIGRGILIRSRGTKFSRWLARLPIPSTLRSVGVQAARRLRIRAFYFYILRIEQA